MKTKLKENIWIRGFKSGEDIISAWTKYDIYSHNIIYQGKTSEIPEELVWIFQMQYCKKENIPCSESWAWNKAKESIRSACNEPYCIIYKTD